MNSTGNLNYPNEGKVLKVVLECHGSANVERDFSIVESGLLIEHLCQKKKTLNALLAVMEKEKTVADEEDNFIKFRMNENEKTVDKLSQEAS